jgi:formate hydrogenlyase subunit 6/NADH:ubiquinone oxidoreductase subunit I
MQGSRNTYWGDIAEGISTLFTGLKLTLKHFGKGFKKNRPPIGIDHADYMKHDEGIFTLQYPNESFPVPDNGRYRLDNEIEDCIVCDKCVKICPVNCIDIEMIRSSEEIRKTSDGSSVRLYASKFDIDMAKCMFCGLCTTVCPTECLTMTKSYDFSEFNLTDLVYNYTDLSPEQAKQKENDWDVFQVDKKKKADTKKAEAGKVATSEMEGAALPKVGGIRIPLPKAKNTGIKIPIPAKKKTEESEGKQPLVPMPKIGTVKPNIVIPAPKKKEGSTQDNSEEIQEETKPKVVVPKPKNGGVAKPIIPKKKED